MDLFAGLDVSLKETSICIVDNDGRITRETKVLSEPEAIRSALGDCADRLGRVGIEASSLGIWLHRELTAAGLRAIVIL
jgi:transposase